MRSEFHWLINWLRKWAECKRYKTLPQSINESVKLINHIFHITTFEITGNTNRNSTTIHNYLRYTMANLQAGYSMPGCLTVCATHSWNGYGWPTRTQCINDSNNNTIHFQYSINSQVDMPPLTKYSKTTIANTTTCTNVMW